MCKINTASQQRENIPSGPSDASPFNSCTHPNVGVFNGVRSSGCVYIYVFHFHMRAYICCDATDMLSHLHGEGRWSEKAEGWRRRRGWGVAAGVVAAAEEESRPVLVLATGQPNPPQGTEQKHLQEEESVVTSPRRRREGWRCGPVHRHAADAISVHGSGSASVWVCCRAPRVFAHFSFGFSCAAGLSLRWLLRWLRPQPRSQLPGQSTFAFRHCRHSSTPRPSRASPASQL